MPPAGLNIQLVFGIDNLVLPVQCPEPSLIFIANLLQRARIVHFYSNGITVQAAQPVPMTNACVQAFTLNGANWVILPFLATTRCAEACDSGFVSQPIEFPALFLAV